MATPSTLWCTDAGAGLKDGTSLANAAVVDPSDVDDIVSLIDALGVLTQDLDIRQCGSASITAVMAPNKDATATYRITYRGRNAGDTDNALVSMDAGDGAFSVFAPIAADYWVVRDVWFTNTNEASGNNAATFTSAMNYLTLIGCEFSHSYRGVSMDSGWGHSFVDCWAHDNANYGLNLQEAASAIGCIASDNGSIGIFRGHCIRCISYGNSFGFYNSYSANQCVAYGNTSDGFLGADTSHAFIPFVDCIATNNGGYGFKCNAATISIMLQRCATYNNTSGRSNTGTGHWIDVDSIVCTADPFIDAANGDFGLNSVAGGGALVRNYDEILSPDGLTTSFHDVGVAGKKVAVNELLR